MLSLLATLLLAVLPNPTPHGPKPMTTPTTHHAVGSFTVDIHPLTPTPASGLARYSIDKHFQGALEATSKGEMLSAGDPKTGNAGYVGIEFVTGALDGRTGAFAIQQYGTMDASGRTLTALITPGSGTGQIDPSGGQHRYIIDYTLPQ